MQATVDGIVLADASTDQLIRIEGTWYFPPSALAEECFRASATAYTCPWKGAARYYDIEAGSRQVRDGAWCYPTPKQSAIARVGADFSGYVAFDVGRVAVR